METSDRARPSPYRHRRWLAPLAAVVALATATTLYGMGSAQAATTTLTVGTTQGPALHDDFIGLSFEAAIVAQPALSNGNLAQYMKTLGRGVARFGGNFVDTTFWTSKGEKAPSWAVTTLTPGDLKRLKTLSTDSGLKVILGVNLKHRDPARAADEAKFAQQILGSALMAIEIGNEPNYHPNYSPSKLYSDYQAYRAAIAHTGIRGEYFHSAIARCGAPKPFYKAYTPFCAATDADAAAGRLIPHPEYYGLLMLQQVGTGNFVPLSNPDPATLRAYAVKNGRRPRLVLDNLTEPQATGSPTVTLKPDRPYTQGGLPRLPPSA